MRYDAGAIMQCLLLIELYKTNMRAIVNKASLV
jgi:hypothetical protein